MRRKKEFEEDDFTVVNMNVEGMPGYVSDEQRAKIDKMREINLTKAEKRAIFWGSFLAILPMALLIIIAFALAGVFCWWWLG